MPSPLIERFPLKRGNHPTRDDGMCAMEMVAWLAGETHSDGPRCTCPVLAALVRSMNDRLPDDRARTRYLRPLVPQLINTRADAAERQRRAYAACDFAVRRLAPMALARRGRTQEARRLADLPRIQDPMGAELAAAVIQNAAPDLRAATWVAERCAAGATAETWIGGVAQAAVDVGSPKVWPGMVDLLLRMIQRPATRAAARMGQG